VIILSDRTKYVLERRGAVTPGQAAPFQDVVISPLPVEMSPGWLLDADGRLQNLISQIDRLIAAVALEPTALEIFGPVVAGGPVQIAAAGQTIHLVNMRNTGGGAATMSITNTAAGATASNTLTEIVIGAGVETMALTIAGYAPMVGPLWAQNSGANNVYVVITRR